MSGRRQRRLVAEINVVPYIDVMMVLLVIFMVTAPMITPGQVDLPSVAKVHDMSTLPVKVTVHIDGHVSVRDTSHSAHDQDMSDGELADWIAQNQANDPNQSVVIAADKSVRYEAVMRVMSIMQRANVKKLGLLAVPEQQH